MSLPPPKPAPQSLPDGPAAKPVKYEHQTLKVLRGREQSKIAEVADGGWELVSQQQGTFRSELTFRRIKPKGFGDYASEALVAFRRLNPKAQLALLVAGGLVLLTSVIAIALSASGDDADRSNEASAAQAESPTPSASPSAQPTETPSAEPSATEISVDDLLDKLNAGESDAGDLFRVTGELFQSDQWFTGVTGDYSVLLKAQGGKQDLPIFVDESEAEKWTDGTKVEVVLQNTEKTIDGDTSDGWLEVLSAKVLSGGTTKEEKESASRQELQDALTGYADTINSGAGTTVIDSIGPGRADRVYYVNLNLGFASLTTSEAQSTIKTMNSQMVDIFDGMGGFTPLLRYVIAGDVVAENKEILDPWDVKFKGMLDD